MRSTHASRPTTARNTAPLICPFDVRVDPIARFLNVELPEHPVYDGLELRWFDDPVHGSGMLAFLSRRADRRVDFYLEPGLRLDRAVYGIGAGIGHWLETPFERSRLSVADDGVDVDVRFTDVEGRTVEVRAWDRTGRVRRPARLLAPVSAGVERPESLLLVLLHRFDLVRADGPAPLVVIAGRRTPIGRLPGQHLHRRHLIKYAAPLTAVTVNRAHDGPVPTVGPDGDGRADVTVDGGIAAVHDRHGEHEAGLAFAPDFPDVAALPEGAVRSGAWQVRVDDVVGLTGGTWRVRRRGDLVEVDVTVTRKWRPDRLPELAADGCPQ